MMNDLLISEYEHNIQQLSHSYALINMVVVVTWIFV
jgi:hypothetical protein